MIVAQEKHLQTLYNDIFEKIREVKIARDAYIQAVTETYYPNCKVEVYMGKESSTRKIVIVDSVDQDTGLINVFTDTRLCPTGRLLQYPHDKVRKVVT